jgi:uncharacterized protein (TIGR02271 family)
VDAPSLWTALTILAAGYILSRGFSRARWAADAPTGTATLGGQSDEPRVHHTASPRLSDDADSEETLGVTLSEERLQVDRRRRPRERVRMRKYVVTEYVTIRVPVRREEVAIERIPLGDDDPGEAGDHEIVLMEEEPVVDKHVVPRERVLLHKDVLTTEQELTDSVRHEEVDFETKETDPT